MAAAAFATFLTCNKAGAKVQYEEHLKRHPDDYESRFRKAYCHLVVKEPSEAAREYREIARRAQSECIKKVANHMAEFSEGKREDSQSKLQSMANDNSQYANSFLVWHYLAEVKRANGHIPEAAEAYKKAASFCPEDVWNQTLCGDTFRQKGDTDAAKEHYLAAIRNNADITLAHAGLSICFLDEGNVEKAKQHLIKANKINPNLVPTTDPYEYRATTNEMECWHHIGKTQIKEKGVNAKGEDVISRGVGPSGKPDLHFILKPSRKAAEEAARAAGYGYPPVEHTTDEEGHRPHFHPAGRDGKIIKSGAHFMY